MLMTWSERNATRPRGVDVRSLGVPARCFWRVEQFERRRRGDPRYCRVELPEVQMELEEPLD